MRLARFYSILGLVSAAVALVALALATPLLGTRADFSAYNSGWNGASTVARDLYGSGSFNPLFSPARQGAGLSLQPVPFTNLVLDPAVDSVLILGPAAGYTRSEEAVLRAFVEGGGTLVLGDDFGNGNEVLTGIGATSRIVHERALDFAFAKRPEFTIAIDFEDHQLTDGVQRALLNYPATIEPGPTARVLANTTEAAWRDVDEDGERDSGEPAGPFPWLVIEPVGQGTVVIVSDPSVLINGMRPFANNERLADDIVAMLVARGGKVVVDEAHRDGADPLAFIGLRLRAFPLLLRIALVAATAGIILAFSTGSADRPVRATRALLLRVLSTPDTAPATTPLLDRVRRKHPDWDETALRELLDAWGVKEPR